MSQNKHSSNLLWAATALGALGILGSYATVGHERFWANWVFWFVLMFTLGLGSLFLVALEHLVNAKWSVPVRRIPERIATLLLPAIPVGLIALCALPVLYPGTRPEAAHNPILAGKAFWLGIPFFSIRHSDFLRPLHPRPVGARGGVAQAGHHQGSGLQFPRPEVRPGLHGNLRAGDHFGGVRLALGADPRVVQRHLRRLRFRGRLPQRPRRHRVVCPLPPGPEPPGGGSQRPPLQPGRLPLRVHGVLVLHRLRPVHADVVRQHARRGHLLQGAGSQAPGGPSPSPWRSCTSSSPSSPW